MRDQGSNALAPGQRHFKAILEDWDRIGLPLRPHPPVPAALAACLPDDPSPLVVLGSTPEFAALAEQAIAVDRAADMLAAIWPKGPGKTSRLGDWRALPVADGAAGAVAGDLSLTLIDMPAGTDAVLAEIARVLRPGGVAALRVALRPDHVASDAEILAYAATLEGEGADALRWRIAIHTAERAGRATVTGADVWQTWDRLAPRLMPIIAPFGWTTQDMARFDLYRDSTMELVFPTAEELLERARMHFEEVSFRPSGDYVLADRLPILRLAKPW